MSKSSKGHLVFDTTVRPRRPFVAALWCFLTLGFAGAFTHNRVNSQLQRLGRQRGAMPFPFIPVETGTATLYWVLGILGWLALVLAGVATVQDAINGYTRIDTEVIPAAATLALMVSPLWMTALHTGRRVKTAQYLVGQEAKRTNPVRLAIAAVLFPPAYTLLLNRAANRMWKTWI